MGTTVELTASDGHQLGAYLAEPAGAPRGGIVIGMEMYGVNDYLKSVCEKYAAAGYAAIAPALFDREEKDLVLPYDSEGMRRGKEISHAVNYDHVLDDVTAAASHIASVGKVAISGYCFGGTITWLSACRCDFDAAIAYYGSNMCDFPDEEAQCPIISHVGDLDTAVPPADVAMFKAKRPEVDWYIYEGIQHGFDSHVRPERYSAEASALAWGRTQDFMAQHIG
ncbi:MAG: carboxymethylenebutenolidase [Rhodospirillaceae bacterium]|nr:carboxymethylenebutenolidase [Rhodospirillaceae bacterium]|tara:strand:- start:14608 stop:15279 length:672 start_codon:yes stop_codon:yes gene_type:complete